MIVKWAVIGAVIGFLIGLLLQQHTDGIITFTIAGGAVGIGFRKWIFTTFWK